MVTVIIELL